MAQVRLVVWNVEHMNRLFVSDAKEAALKPRTDETDDVLVGERLDDITAVLAALDPDCLVVVEGPSRPEEFALFFENMEGQWVTHLQLTRRPNYSSQQNIGIAVRTDRGLFAADAVHGFDSAQEAAFKDFEADVDLDRVPERYHYERLPLHAEVRMADGGRFRVLGVHLKSKALGDAVEWGRWWALAEGNRRRILAQARNLHAKFIRPYLQDEELAKVPLLVCGDVNDGPGFDAAEKRLMGSGIEALTGTIWQPEYTLRNALFESLKPEDQAAFRFERLSTTRFPDPIFNKKHLKVWLDHLLYSVPGGRQWVHSAEVVTHLPSSDGGRLEDAVWRTHPHASDHQPLFALLEP